MSERQKERHYRIGRSCPRLLKLKTHVLRFWEAGSHSWCHLRTAKGQRLLGKCGTAAAYPAAFLHEQGMTIERRAACPAG